MATKPVAIVTGLATALVGSRFVETEGVLVASIRSRVALVDVDAGRLVLALFVVIFVSVEV